MAIIQNHHITYSTAKGEKEWVVELTMMAHRMISRIQMTRATPEQYAMLTNLVHSIVYEWNRVRRELDCGGDYRVVNPNKKKTKGGVKANGKKGSEEDNE